MERRAHLVRRALHAALALPRPVKQLVAGPPVRIDGQQLDLDVQLLRRVLTPRRPAPVPAPDRMRAGQAFVDRLVAGPEEPGVRREDRTVPGAAGELPARLYVPDEMLRDGDGLLVYVHGGGFVAGDLDSHDGLCGALAAEAGVRVLSIGYRLAPEHPFPAAVDDCLAAFAHVAARPEEFGAAPGRVAIGGDSAGASLALTVARETSGGPGATPPVFCLAFFPVTRLDGRTRSRELFGDGYFLTTAAIETMARWYVPDEMREDPRLRIAEGDLSGMPATYVATAGFDPLRDEGEDLVARLRAAGVPAVLRRHPDLTHGFATTLGIGTRPRQAVAEAAGALRTALALLPGTATRPS
ncbi:acetyl esterase [Pseudonocardia ammonioxydans]|uniref:Acetyl esterase n=1 Tax=Pseudonocardia ammonioxydans TaxID=260086 RepID=A0A1I4WJJ2_PSUAM|nr:alpha/beta hydrolase [Pseudonocardia ammonioxydans]SFN13627.1 acetyl esterase [Pseudonocardia ammonioxydans]